MSLTLDALARDYFAKQKAYRRLFGLTTTSDEGRVILELAIRDALDAVVDASMKLDAARREQRT